VNKTSFLLAAILISLWVIPVINRTFHSERWAFKRHIIQSGDLWTELNAEGRKGWQVMEGRDVGVDAGGSFYIDMQRKY
jgi:hypothetical protein